MNSADLDVDSKQPRTNGHSKRKPDLPPSNNPAKKQKTTKLAAGFFEEDDKAFVEIQHSSMELDSPILTEHQREKLAEQAPPVTFTSVDPSQALISEPMETPKQDIKKIPVFQNLTLVESLLSALTPTQLLETQKQLGHLVQTCAALLKKRWEESGKDQ